MDAETNKRTMRSIRKEVAERYPNMLESMALMPDRQVCKIYESKLKKKVKPVEDPQISIWEMGCLK